MRHAQERPTPLTQITAETSRPAAGVEISETESPVTAEELTRLRQEKLDAIRLAITRGDYDSDEFLDKAMDLMLQRIEELHDSSGL